VKIKQSPISLSWPRLACLSHAFLVCAIWVLEFKFDRDVISGRPWMVLALAWFPWLTVFGLAQRVDRIQWIIVIAIGLALLTPTMPTLYTFVVWSIDGFAP
jgi:hypothetical protein